MDPSYRLVPTTLPKSASVNETANSLGLHDTLQYGPRSIATENQSRNGLQSRLAMWEETQDNTRLTMLRDLHGLHAPARLLMERKIVATNHHMPAMPQTNLHLDILMGRDETLDPSDFFGGMETGPSMSIHTEMEKKLRL
ncbi:proteasome maturation factor UMP1 [Hygrophoropsis aurantiaca]|uniref:Proteasome maturation factor UMP1 n=1 Tax=Hygrophoropsis aurantiaca TaxID=72124 RepID=A0ACB8ATX7_9AGAM|nr:proteasome maturation factor UMP1 [Hygrophoropsis aurantiaca]